MKGATVTTTTKTGLRVGVLGPLRVERDGAEVDPGSPKQRAVLAILVSSRGRAVSRDRIIEGVWPDFEDFRLVSGCFWGSRRCDVGL
jgi:two-component SAPR family response regulator